MFENVVGRVNREMNNTADRFDWGVRTYKNWEDRLTNGDVHPMIQPLPEIIKGGLRWAVFGSRKFVQVEGLLFSMVAGITGGRHKSTFEPKSGSGA